MSLTCSVFNEFWEAPKHLWRSKVRSISEDEMNAIYVGASAVYLSDIRAEGLQRTSIYLKYNVTRYVTRLDRDLLNVTKSIT